MFMFNYCPSCGSKKITFDNSHKWSCPDCGFVYYHNTAAATGCVISTKAGIMLLVRGRDPAQGKLDLPGGFVDPGEGAFEGLRRELREEIGWEPEPTAILKLFASFPNVYPYKNIVYNTCDLFFTIDAPDLNEADLKLEAVEIAGVKFVKPADINPDDLAFDSTRRAIRVYLELLQ
ncbi:DNA mismatch repair protein MutT [Spirochaetia bacterium]|nr:DNA mismatch repair protein MutT [Spirochaetia bacterium]